MTLYRKVFDLRSVKRDGSRCKITVVMSFIKVFEDNREIKIRIDDIKMVELSASGGVLCYIVRTKHGTSYQTTSEEYKKL